MPYEVTATRKRPQVFEKLVGQEFVVSTIENAIDSGRIAHAYLFSGPRGVGKTSSARLLAKALNCEKGPTAHPCGECASCREITSGSSVDVIEIDGASNTSVNDIRVIKDEVLFPPQASRYKIYIIDEVHMLSNSAFNALLKTIEEPPEYIIFIFATTELQKVPATIRSRCQQFHFQLIGLSDIRKCLSEAAAEMGIKADDDAIFWIAKEAAGSMRDAYTLFDQVAAFSGDHITLAQIKDKLGLVGATQIASIVTQALAGDRKGAMTTLSTILAQGVSVEQCIRDFTDFFRTLLLLKEGIDSEELISMRKEDVPDEVIQALSAIQIEAALRYLMQCYREVRYSINPRFELELFVSRLSSLPYLSTPEELVAKLQELKDDIAQGKATVVREQRVIQPLTVQAPQGEPTPAAPPQEQPHNGQQSVASEEENAPFVEEEEVPPPPPETPQARIGKDVLPSLVAAGEDSGIFSLGASMSQVFELRPIDDELCLMTHSSYALKTLNASIAAVRDIVKAQTGWQGRVCVLLEEEKEDAVDPMMEKLAKAFRGQIIKENHEP